VGRYELLEVIGSGGMGTVWKAWDQRLDRMVALKRPHPLPPGDPRRDRLVREARLAASVSHPNLVEVYDVGVDEDGPFLVMQFVDAPSLREVGRGLDRREILSAGAQVARALAAIHEVGIVHRDVKPSNVLMAPGGAKLVDFGVALALDGQSGFEPTAPGVVLGTAGYTAPEVQRGRPATPKSDVFGLGVIMAELLDGLGPLSALAGCRSSAEQELVGSVLSACIADDPGRRPDAVTVARALEGARAPDAPIVLAAGEAVAGSPTTRMRVETAAQGDDTAVVPPELQPTAAVPARRSRPGDGWFRGTAVLAGGATMSLVLVVAAAVGFGAIGSPEESVDVRPSLPLNASTITEAPATSTTVEAAAPTTSSPGRSVPRIRLGDRGAVRSALSELLGTAANGSDEAEKAAERIEEKLADASEALADGKPAKALKKLEEAAEYAKKDLDGDARARTLAGLENWAAQLGLPLDEIRPEAGD